MAFTDRLKLIIDADVRGFTSGISEIKTKIGDADGFFGKLKAGAGGLGDMFKSLGPAASAGLAAGGVGAVASAAFEAVSKFEDLGLAVGDFADKTGQSTQESSRWVEVAKDMGIDVGSLEGVLGKMNKQLDPAKWAAYGIEIARAKDGTVDVNATFLNAIDHLHGVADATERAKEGAKLFGKGWATVSELVSEGADKLRGRLQDVADVKILSPQDVKDARSFRDAMDQLHDIGEELVLTFGKALLPAMTSLAKTIGEFKGPIEKTGEALGFVAHHAKDLWDLADPLAAGFEKVGLAAGHMIGDRITGQTLDLTAAIKGLNLTNTDAAAELDVVSGAAGAFNVEAGAAGVTADALALAQGRAAKAAADLAESTDRAKRSAEALQGQWDALKGSISDDQAFINVQNQFDNVKTAAQASWDAASSGAADATQKARDNASAVDDLKLKVIDFGKTVLGLPPDRIVKVLGEIDNGSLDLAANQLAIWARNHTMNVSIVAKGAPGFNTTGTPHFAGGGHASAGQFAVVGEDGPELVQFGSDATVTPAGQTRQIMSGGTAGRGDTFIIYTRETSDREIANMRARAARRGVRV